MATLAMSGCASINQEYLANPVDTQLFVSKKPAELQPFFKTLFEEGDRNAVLNQDRLALAAIETQHYDIAAKALDDAIARIDSIYSDNAAAEAARSKFNEEKVKDFKGEAYERAMTYYYRGLLYLRTGEYDNARAAFLGASLQDKFSENQTYNQDFAVMDYLAGWSSMCMGDTSTASDHMNRAKSINASLSDIVTNPPKNLAIMDVGYGPIKVRSGQYNEILQFIDNPANGKTIPHLYSSNTEIGTPVLASDLFYQATTRGGRVVDSINAGKANFKNNAETVAKVGEGIAATGLAMSMAGNQNGGYVAGGGLLIALVSAGVAAATTPEADARYWENLPKQIYLTSLDVTPPVNENISLKLDTASDSYAFPLKAQNGACSFSWSRAPSARQITPSTQIIPADTDEERGPRNVNFREQLKTAY